MLKNITARLITMNFLQFFVWGAWLTTCGNYCTNTMGWSFAQFGAVFSTMGISSLFMPSICGYIADRYINSERLYGILHILGGISLLMIPAIDTPSSFFWIILMAMIFYMPTIALSNSVAYSILINNKKDLIKSFPPIRVLGTVGFIAATWLINLLGFNTSYYQFVIGGIGGIVLGIYAFTLPACPPNKGDQSEGISIFSAFKLLKEYKMLLFFLFSMLLGAALQLTNAYGETFLYHFSEIKKYANSFAVANSTFVMSLSQISETVFILIIPFMMKRFGIKKVMLFSMIAWVLRFGLFSFGNPTDGVWMILLSNVIYGFAFDFFNISGSLFVETSTDSRIRSSAQGLFMMMTNGFGAILGSIVSGFVIDNFYTLKDESLDWSGIWLCFAIYAAIVSVLFALLFKHKHNPNELTNINH
jgi:MFS transporter, NHS family, xanthosine permease